MEVISKRKRIQIYKIALDLYENKKDGDTGLCQLLRDICIQKTNERNWWYYIYTSKKFPELYNIVHMGNIYKFKHLYETNRNLWRRVILRYILETMGVDTIKLDE